MLIGDKLIQLRREKGYSQEQLANMLNVSRQAVSKWEAGNSTPELDKIIMLADIFNVSVDYLVRDNLVNQEPIKRAENNPDSVEVMLQLDEIKKSIKKQNIYEYKSKKTILGLPLVHIKLARNGMALACGIIAIGNASIGIISLGGIALGLISLGGLALGILGAFGGLAVGTIAFAGLSIGILALGGIAIGVYAVGGIAVASAIAIGGIAKGNIALGQIVDGTYTMYINEATKEQVKELIQTKYPDFNRTILNLFLGFLRK